MREPSGRYDPIFGPSTDPIAHVAQRAAAMPSARQPIVWEGDAATFQFLFVSENAERLLGYPTARWTSEATFWADVVVHPRDREEAIAYCALATGKKADHEFEYRAVRADGAVIWLLDVVRVVMGARGVPERLRGLMFDITAAKQSVGQVVRVGDLWVRPSRAELERLAG